METNKKNTKGSDLPCTSNQKSGRCTKTSRQQYAKIENFMQSHVDFPKGKMKETEENRALINDWNILTNELNDLGPPIHTSDEWRKVWTDYKANQKRNKAAATTVESSESATTVVSDHNYETLALSIECLESENSKASSTSIVNLNESTIEDTLDMESNQGVRIHTPQIVESEAGEANNNFDTKAEIKQMKEIVTEISEKVGTLLVMLEKLLSRVE